MASTLNLDDEDDFGGDVPGSQSSTKHSDGKRKFGDLDEEEEDVFGRKGKPKIEESGPGMTTGMILSLRESLQNCRDNLTSCQQELEVAKSEIQKWHSAFQYGPATPTGMSPEPGLVLTFLQNLKSSEESLKEQLEKAKKREAAFIVTFAKREQEIADLKSAVRDLKTQLRPPSMQDLLRKKIIGKGHESGGLYILDTSFQNSFACSSITFPFKAHCRLGHPSLPLLKKLFPQYGKVSSLDCESCQFAKHHHLSSSPRVNDRATIPFKLVHFDIWVLVQFCLNLILGTFLLLWMIILV